MNAIASNKPAIFIDQRKARIRIHRNTLHMLGDPAFIQILVNPEILNVGIRPAVGANSFTHRILWKQMGEKQSYELHSSILVHKLQKLCLDWVDGVSYRVLGEFLQSEKIALFDLSKVQPILVIKEENCE